jgi:uncharacterized UBP type Zn finger protein
LVALGGDLVLNHVMDQQPHLMRPIAIIKHSGPNIRDEHYTCHIRRGDVFYWVNDDQDIVPTPHPGFPQLGQVYIYTEI